LSAWLWFEIAGAVGAQVAGIFQIVLRDMGDSVHRLDLQVLIEDLTRNFQPSG
jgi:hypothetical protein